MAIHRSLHAVIFLLPRLYIYNSIPQPAIPQLRFHTSLPTPLRQSTASFPGCFHLNPHSTIQLHTLWLHLQISHIFLFLRNSSSSSLTTLLFPATSSHCSSPCVQPANKFILSVVHPGVSQASTFLCSNTSAPRIHFPRVQTCNIFPRCPSGSIPMHLRNSLSACFSFYIPYVALPSTLRLSSSCLQSIRCLSIVKLPSPRCFLPIELLSLLQPSTADHAVTCVVIFCLLISTTCKNKLKKKTKKDFKVFRFFFFSSLIRLVFFFKLDVSILVSFFLLMYSLAQAQSIQILELNFCHSSDTFNFCFV